MEKLESYFAEDKSFLTTPFGVGIIQIQLSKSFVYGNKFAWYRYSTRGFTFHMKLVSIWPCYSIQFHSFNGYIFVKADYTINATLFRSFVLKIKWLVINCCIRLAIQIPSIDLKSDWGNETQYHYLLSSYINSLLSYSRQEWDTRRPYKFNKKLFSLGGIKSSIYPAWR